MKFSSFFILILILISGRTAQAQYKPFQFGFQGGFNIGWFAAEDAPFQNEGVDIGGSYGFVADIFLMENYAFTTGFKVIYLNGNTTSSAQNGPLDRNIHTRYLQLPLLFTMKTKPIKEKFSIYGQVGYGIAFLLQAKSMDTFRESDGDEVSEKNNINDELTFTRSSLIFGAGIEIPIHGSTAVRAGFTFDNCFVNMFKGDEFRVRNSFFDINLAVLF
ncbi:MAG: porin family protein [bacterium]